ncbi:hypothetical protein ANN_03720 [Periplaneta americana]|uniref:Uncharacterized protein n=1 Tax=Periplaneta americana TaxID=6978 RepID=A0ABQ8TZR4_PERAM|nr:hypothetical protein ANN_03720 [Periplaneta americana]
MSPGSSTESYPAFARIGLRENPGKNLNQVTCPDRDSNPGHLVSQPDALTVTPQYPLVTLRYCIVIDTESHIQYRYPQNVERKVSILKVSIAHGDPFSPTDLLLQSSKHYSTVYKSSCELCIDIARLEKQCMSYLCIRGWKVVSFRRPGGSGFTSSDDKSVSTLNCRTFAINLPTLSQNLALFNISYAAKCPLLDVMKDSGRNRFLRASVASHSDKI